LQNRTGHSHVQAVALAVHDDLGRLALGVQAQRFCARTLAQQRGETLGSYREGGCE
jgi:hypothetical protein